MHKHGISIWLFIGAMLLIYGVLILISGIWELFNPPAVALAMSQTHAAIWWGAIMLVLGIFYCVKFRPGTKSQDEGETAAAGHTAGHH